MLAKFSGSVWRVSREFPECQESFLSVRRVSWVSGVSWHCPEHLEGFCRVPREFHDSAQGALRELPGSVRTVSRDFPQMPRDISESFLSRQFPASVQELSGQFDWQNLTDTSFRASPCVFELLHHFTVIQVMIYIISNHPCNVEELAGEPFPL